MYRSDFNTKEKEKKLDIEKKGRFIILSRHNDKISFPHGLSIYEGRFLGTRVN